MSFPQTRHTLIRRLASGGSEEDWREFVSDYWGPMFRFALRRGSRNPDEAEDVASQAFEVLLRNRLLSRWTSAPRAKLRTLLCSVVVKIQANRSRTSHRQVQLLRELDEQLGSDRFPEDSTDAVDSFYAAWVDDLLGRTMDVLAVEYHREGKGDYFRVLYGRLCEGLSIAKVGEALELKPSDVDNYYRHVRKRLRTTLESAVRDDVQRYCTDETADDEFTSEWQRLGRYLHEVGGIEEAVRRAYANLDLPDLEARKAARVQETLSWISPPAGED